MDYVRFHCPACNHLLVVPPEAAGMSGPCPNCHTIIQGPNHNIPPQPQPLNPPQEEIPTLHPQKETPPAPNLVQNPSPLQGTPISQALDSPHREQSDTFPLPTETSDLTSQPQEAFRHPLSSNQRTRGLSFAQAFALCFFASLTFFILGFVLGKSGAVPWSSILQQAQQQRTLPPPNSTPSPAPSDHDDVPITPLEVTPADSSETLTTARATLETFLAADTWAARNTFVLNAKEVLPLMAASATIHGDGPISFDSINLHTEGPNLRVFWVKTSQHPLPFSVMMLKEDDWWLVDWPGFADFYYDRLGAFSRGRDGAMKGVFRVLLKAAPGETSPLSPSRCLVKAPQSSNSYQVNSLAESPARRKLAEIFQAYQQGEPERFKEAINGDGIPLIVEISRSGAENPTLQLEQIITTGWPPLPSEQLEKNPSSRFY